MNSNSFFFFSLLSFRYIKLSFPQESKTQKLVLGLGLPLLTIFCDQRNRNLTLEIDHVFQARYYFISFFLCHETDLLSIQGFFLTSKKHVNIGKRKRFRIFSELLHVFSVNLGGKAKPLKQPKADKKEYDEVCFLLR